MATTAKAKQEESLSTRNSGSGPVSEDQRLQFRTTFLVALAGGILLWAAFPPLGWWPLAWLAPVPWLWLVLQPRSLGRSGYWAVWLASFAQWAAMLFGVALAHPLLIGGWLVLSAYVAAYLPIFVLATRTLIHFRKWPLVIAAPVVWVGLEYVRAYFATGFSLGMLSQTQTPVPILLQTSDLAGAYVPSFLMTLAAAAISLWTVKASLRDRAIAGGVAVALLIAALVYGGYRLQQPLAEGPSIRVMLVQGSMDTVLDGDPKRPQQMIEHYRDLTFDHLDEHPPCDLVVWPESAFIYPKVDADPLNLPQTLSAEDYQASQQGLAEILKHYAELLNRRRPGTTHFLVGGNTFKLTQEGEILYNSAFLISPEGDLRDQYFKTHLVMFGEYIPLGEWLPWIYQLAPIRPSTPGKEYLAFSVSKLHFAPNICFESTVPQLFVRQGNALALQNREPDVLINTTNDGWFYGSAILDLHFQCAVLRAIENRKPFLVAANTGISGVIDGNGKALAQAPKRQTAILVNEVKPDGRRPLFRTVGDLPAGVCALLTLVGLVWRRQSRPQSSTDPA